MGEETVTPFVWMRDWYSNFSSVLVRFAAVVDPEGSNGLRESDRGCVPAPEKNSFLSTMGMELSPWATFIMAREAIAANRRTIAVEPSRCFNL